MGTSPHKKILSIDVRAKENAVDRMKEYEIFNGMGNPETLMFAFALGYHERIRQQVSNRLSGGFVRQEYVKPHFEMLAKAARFADLGFADVNELQDAAAIDDAIEEYANFGFQVLEGEFERNVTSEELANSLIEEMNKLYKKYSGDNAFDAGDKNSKEFDSE